MQRIRVPSWSIRFLGVLALLLSAAIVRAQGDLPAIAELPSLARTGDLSRVLSTLKAQPFAAEDVQVASLVSDIQRYETHRAEQLAQRRQAYDKALQKIADARRDGKIDDEILGTVEAHSLAEDPAALLRTPETADLVTRAQAAADTAQKAGDWLEAASLYRLLGLLFEESGRYRGTLKEIEQRIRLVRVYAPKTLETMLREQATRLGRPKERVDAITVSNETWQQTLDGVDVRMLRRSLAQAAKLHVSGTNYVDLMTGATDALTVLVRTPQLTAVFPQLGDAAKRGPFEEGIEGLRRSIAGSSKNDFGYIDASRIVDRVLDLNKQTLALPDAVLIYEMANGAMGRLDDFTAVIWPHERDEFTRTTSGKFSGVGIQISRHDSRLTVVTPLGGTPAQLAGIKPGDVIAQVDGQSTEGWTLDQAVRNITGPVGTTVALGIDRPGEPEMLTFRIKRVEIAIESIKGWSRIPGADQWDYYIDPDMKIGYVRLTNFMPQTAADLDAAVNWMERQGGVNGLILDLRFDPGGLLEAAIDVCDRFVKSGVLVSTVRGDGTVDSQAFAGDSARASRGTGPAARQARPQNTYAPFPLVVMVNEGSASASEIVSGCLQDYQRATIVGTRSFGKGSVQELFRLDENKAFLKLTTHYYQLPKGRIIHRKPGAAVWGVEPDVVVKMTPQQVADSLAARQELDILRDPAAADKPVVPVVEDPAPEDGGAPAVRPNVRNIRNAAQIREQGLDPQLEAALLILKTQLVAKDVAMAQTPAPAPAPVH